MFIGHYGPAFAARAKAPSLSLGWWFVLVQWVDVLFMSLLVLGIEHMRLVPGFTRFNPYDLYDMPISHSVVGITGWSAAAGLAVGALRRSTGVGALAGLAVLSHLLLDLPMHTPDLTLAGPGTPRLGLGLWNHPVASTLAELAVLGAGLLLYARARGGWRGLRVFAAVLVVLTIATPLMPPPPSPVAFAVQALVAYLALAWVAARVDRRP